MARGRFITLEGGEGAGKSTLARGLAAALEPHVGPVELTREPGGTPNAEAIRALLLEGETGRWSPVSETLLLYAARADHAERRIRPALDAGRWVICDRFSDSTRAYQGAAGGMDAGRIAAIDAAVMEGLAPDLTLILDLDPEAGLQRALDRGEDATRFERHGLDFHRALREGFLDIARDEPVRCAVIDSSQPPETVLAAALAVIDARLGAGR